MSSEKLVSHLWHYAAQGEAHLLVGYARNPSKDRFIAIALTPPALNRPGFDGGSNQRIFRPGGARPPIQVLRSFVAEHRDAFGVEPICRQLQIAPSGYRHHFALQRHPERRSERVRRDEMLMPEIERVWRSNLQVYGADKLWRQLNREGIEVARCTVERLMRRQGLRGVVRGKVVRTTASDSKAHCPMDRVNRQFKADRPNQLWV